MKVFLGLGSNVGDRRAHLARAVSGLRSWSAAEVLDVSGLYESEYVGPGLQGSYLNACVALDCLLDPPRILARTQELEIAAGREPDSHLRPRSLDVDILLIGERTVRTDRLVIPHPRLADRRFVLEPLAELDPGLVVPGLEATVLSLLQSPRVRAQRLERLADSPWIGEVMA
jgi:2-amino-4-hydroxy-6-hydroxymethyldihydropteridine diphosphokinase